MKKLKITILFSIFIPAFTFADSLTLPMRRPGLWQVTVSNSMAPEQIIKQCTDKTTDAKMIQSGFDMAEKMGASCKKNEMKKEGNKFIGFTDCSFKGMQMVSRSVFSGDFNSTYTGEVITKYDPPMMGMGDMKTNITGKWLGPCAANQKPGDVVMSNGMSMNIDSLGEMGKMLSPEQLNNLVNQTR